MPARSSDSSSGRKAAVSLAFAPTSRWARVTAGRWVTADSRCRWRWCRCAKPEQRLAVHRDRRPRLRAGGADGGVVVSGQVGADRGVQGIAVEDGQEPGEGGMGRGAATSGQVAADAEPLQHRGGGALSPLGDLGDGPGAGDDCTRRSAASRPGDTTVRDVNAGRVRTGGGRAGGRCRAGGGDQFRQNGRDRRGWSGRHGTSM